MNIYPGFPRLCFFEESLAKDNFLETWEYNSITIASEVVLYDSPMLTVPGLGMENAISGVEVHQGFEIADLHLDQYSHSTVISNSASHSTSRTNGRYDANMTMKSALGSEWRWQGTPSIAIGRF